MRKRWWLALSGTAFAIILSGALALYAWQLLHAPLQIPAEGAWVEVASGTPLRRVSADLADRGLLKHPQLLTLYARATGDATRVRAGEYQLAPGVTPISLLEKLVSGQVYLHQITVVEGWKFDELLRVLRTHPAIAVTELDGAGIMAALGSPEMHPEGQFLPETYRFPRGTTDVELLRTAHHALQQRLDAAWQSRAADNELDTPYEALILASIIEKETALATERRLISGVFHERLRRGMRLQTDPTVIYGLGAAFDGNLRRRDLDADTPYNTYTRTGLPPTPIALPGGLSIDAAVNPEATDAVYFVATGRSDGSHKFSATLEEHEQAVRDYLRALRGREP